MIFQLFLNLFMRVSQRREEEKKLRETIKRYQNLSRTRGKVFLIPSGNQLTVSRV